MDTFNFLLSMILMLMAIQFGQLWLVVGIVLLSVLTSKDFGTMLMFVIGAVVLYFFVSAGDVDGTYWLPIILGLVVLSLLLGGKQEQPAPDPFGGLGGMGGFGGMEGMG